MSNSLTERAKRIAADEIERYTARTVESRRLVEDAKALLPLGVPSSFQYYDPSPIVAVEARGSKLTDADGNTYLDFNMGYGALMAGHAHPELVAAIADQAAAGTLYVTPCPGDFTAARALIARIPAIDMVRFTNSGTESTMDALRLARGFTGRNRVVKLEGGYHGHSDELMISVKPSLEAAGPAAEPRAVPYSGGITPGTIEDMYVVPFNDEDALARVFAAHGEEIAAFILEPCMQNIGIALPTPGYLEAARRITQEHGALLVFDEVKTGITAGYGGASEVVGVTPDIVCLAKSIGGGVPVGAFGGRADIMGLIADGTVLHLGTFNGNPLSMAAVDAVLNRICTRDATEAAIARNRRLLDGLQDVIDQHDLPAHTVQFGAKGCVTYSRTPVRNYRDYKSTDFDLAYAHWMWMVNRGVLLPPGLDEQWLISVQTTDEDTATHLQAFTDFAAALTE